MKAKIVILVPAIVSVVGCASPVPVAQNFPISYQKLAATAHHWDVVADDVVEQTAAALESKEQLRGRGVYVLPAPQNTAFDNAFRNFMINQMVKRDLRVAVCHADSATKGGFVEEQPDVVVRYETQIIAHGDDLPNYAPGRLTALAAGVAVLRNASHANLTRGQVNAAGIVAGALADWGLGHVANPTRTELIVTTTIAEGNRYILRRNDIYYVPDADAHLFFHLANSF